MKTCIACKHFSIKEDYNWSEITFENAAIECDKGHFYHTLDDALKIREALLTKAQTCPDYELSDLAKAKGWKE